MKGGSAAIPAVRRVLQVPLPVDAAFELFGPGMAKWWPMSHHIAVEPFDAIVLEPRAGGRWFERDANGTETDWGRVLAWDAQRELKLAWHLQADWHFESDSARASELLVRFVPESSASTRVEFEHSGFERHGEAGASIRERVDHPGGWTLVLDAYLREAKSQAGA